MVIRMVQNYGIALDAIGLVLCVGMIAYLIRNRVKTGSLIRRPGATPDFGDQVLQSMVSQQTRRVLMAAMAKVGEELQLLARGAQKDLLAGDLLSRRIETLPLGADTRRGVQLSPHSPPHLRSEPLEAVFGLLETGAAVADISRSVQRPVGEIELCAWLVRHRVGSRKKPETG